MAPTRPNTPTAKPAPAARRVEVTEQQPTDSAAPAAPSKVEDAERKPNPEPAVEADDDTSDDDAGRKPASHAKVKAEEKVDAENKGTLREVALAHAALVAETVAALRDTAKGLREDQTRILQNYAPAQDDANVQIGLRRVEGAVGDLESVVAALSGTASALTQAASWR